jgi:hypothetical protein
MPSHDIQPDTPSGPPAAASSRRRGFASAHEAEQVLVRLGVVLASAMLLGEAQAAPYAAVYLVVTLGNGFRYGAAYLYFAASLAALGFGFVYLEHAAARATACASRPAATR